MSEKAILQLDGKSFELPIVIGTEGEKAIDISTLRDTTGYITLDDGYGNTGACSSAITFIDGEKGILRYRGIPIEELAVKSTFIETAYLLIYGKLPNRGQLQNFSDLLTENQNLHEGMKHHFEGFPAGAHPDGDPLGHDQRQQLLLSGLDGAAGRATISTIQAARLHFAGAHHRGVLLPEIPRAAVHLSQAELQLHRQFPAHDVFRSL